MTASLVVTVIGEDRPGIVSALADIARRFDANWAGSHMASLAGQFAGIVHLETTDASCEALISALRALDRSGLHVAIARGARAPAGGSKRSVRLELVGHDRPGIVRDLSGSLAAIGVSIDELHTQIVSAAMAGGHLFKMKALLAVPPGIGDDRLRASLEAIANEMMVDIEAAAADAAGAGPDR